MVRPPVIVFISGGMVKSACEKGDKLCMKCYSACCSVDRCVDDFQSCLHASNV